MLVGNPHGRPFIAPKKQILAFLWRIANQEPAWAVGQIDLMMDAKWNRKFRYFQVFGKKDNLERLNGIFETKFSKYSVPFDFVPEFPEILASWIAPSMLSYFRNLILNLKQKKKRLNCGLFKDARPKSVLFKF